MIRERYHLLGVLSADSKARSFQERHQRREHRDLLERIARGFDAPHLPRSSGLASVLDQSSGLASVLDQTKALSARQTPRPSETHCTVLMRRTYFLIKKREPRKRISRDFDAALPSSMPCIDVFFLICCVLDCPKEGQSSHILSIFKSVARGF